MISQALNYLKMNTETQNEIAETNTEVVGPSQEKIFIQLKKLPEIPKTYKKYDKLNEKQKKKIDDIWNALSKEVKDKIIEDANNYVETTNRGTGAGGANTNANGLPFEEKVDLKTEYASCKDNNSLNNGKIIQSKKVTFHNSDKEFEITSKTKFHPLMISKGERDLDITVAPGCKEPDEAYIDTNGKNMFIIEKKFQKGSGSVIEKIQSGDFKTEHYGELFPNYKIYYIYTLCDYFKGDEQKSVLKYLQKKNIPVFWGDDADYKSKIIEFILNNSV